jgi:hypothetical protein
LVTATIVAGGLAEIECADSKSAASESPPRQRFSVVDQSEHFTAKPPLKK